MAHNTETAHTVKSYDEELALLVSTIARMGALAESQLANAVQAMLQRDSDLANQVVTEDVTIDELEQDVHKRVVRLLALRQPLAIDLRHIVIGLKVSSDLERIADYATNLAKRSIVLNQFPLVNPVTGIVRMSRLAQELIRDVIDAYIERDRDKAITTWRRDEEVDEMYVSLFRELVTYMMEDPRNITACTHLMFMAKNIERIGDHVTNIAESIHFLIEGTPLRGRRSKGETYPSP